MDKQDLPWVQPYYIHATKKESEPGYWSTNEVEIRDKDNKVLGSYKYNYSGKPPFFPFELNGQWYALYSKYYTASRIMKLPSCEDVWSEDPSAHGFCPVEFYVPAVQNIDFKGDRTGKFAGTFNSNPEEFEEPHETDEWIIQPISYSSFGFVSGCIWGDDSSMKIRFFDLTKIKEGIITYDDRFGYIELHNKLSLAESINIWNSFSDIDKCKISITTNKVFNFKGELDKDD